MFPFFGAVISFLYYNALKQGMFVEWVSLGKPPADKVIRVIWADYVETDSGDLYHYEHNVNYPSEGNWVRSAEISPSIDSDYWVPLERCVDAYKLPSLDRFINSKIVCEHWGVGIYLTITAVDDVGNVYSWGKGIGEYDGILILASPFIGAILGLLVSVLVLIIMLLIDSVKSLKEQLSNALRNKACSRWLGICAFSGIFHT